MIGRASSRNLRRVAAAGLLALLGLAVWQFAIAPIWQEIRSTQTALAKAQKQEAALQARIAKLKVASEQPNDQPVSVPLWSGRADGAQSAKIQGAVQTLARSTEVALRAVSARGQRSFEDRPAISVLVETRASFDRAARFLHAIETHEPALLIENASFRVLGPPREDRPFPDMQVRLELLAPLAISSGEASQ